MTPEKPKSAEIVPARTFEKLRTAQEALKKEAIRAQKLAAEAADILEVTNRELKIIDRYRDTVDIVRELFVLSLTLFIKAEITQKNNPTLDVGVILEKTAQIALLCEDALRYVRKKEDVCILEEALPQAKAMTLELAVMLHNIIMPRK